MKSDAILSHLIYVSMYWVSARIKGREVPSLGASWKETAIPQKLNKWDRIRNSEPWLPAWPITINYRSHITPRCSSITPIIIYKSYTPIPRGEKGHNKAFKKLFNTSAFTEIDGTATTKQEKMCLTSQGIGTVNHILKYCWHRSWKTQHCSHISRGRDDSFNVEIHW